MSEEREERDKRLFVYCYNQGGELSRRDNGGKPYPSLQSVRGRMMTSKYRHNGLREKQKKRALDGWERMNVKRSLEDSLRCVLLYSFLDEEY